MSLPTANGCAPRSPNSLRAAAGRASLYGGAAAGCPGWVGSAQSGRSGGAERARLLREAETVAGAGARGAEGGEVREASQPSCTARTAAFPPAPPAAPLTFHLQEKLPSRRRRRRSFPHLGEPRVAAGLRGCTAGLSVREPRPPSLPEVAY